MALADT